MIRLQDHNMTKTQEQTSRGKNKKLVNITLVNNSYNNKLKLLQERLKKKLENKKNNK